MANPDHVRLAKQGVEALARWWQENPEDNLDLSGAELRGAELKGASLLGAGFLGADLDMANLSYADLRGANLREVNLSRANLSRADLSWSNFGRANLSEANLYGANLTGAHLNEADARRANLTRANLSEASLNGANLTGARLVQTRLGWANLCWANLSKTDLSRANLRAADISGANLTDSDLGNAILADAMCGSTTFANTCLSGCRGLESVVHKGPSSIGVATLVKSRGTTAATFFVGAGVSREVVVQLAAILADVTYCSCFICYGDPQKVLAEKLRNQLLASGVSCWVYAMDATPGERTWHEIGQKRRGADKVVVLCSAQALVRDGVLKEIEEQIDEDPDKLLPVSLDNLWKEPGFRVMRGNRDLKPFLLERNYADFSDPSRYQETLERLLKALERKQG